jgi:anti-sigma B factor antagonist
MTTRTSQVDSVHVLSVDGEIDFSVADEFDALLSASVATATSPIVVDLTDVRYVDSSGLTCFVRAYQKMHARNRFFGLVVGPGIIRDVLRVTGLDEVFDLYLDLKSALVAAREFDAARDPGTPNGAS